MGIHGWQHADIKLIALQRRGRSSVPLAARIHRGACHAPTHTVYQSGLSQSVRPSSETAVRHTAPTPRINLSKTVHTACHSAQAQRDVAASWTVDAQRGALGGGWRWGRAAAGRAPRCVCASVRSGLRTPDPELCALPLGVGFPLMVIPF